MKNLKKIASVGMISVLMLGMVACQGANKKSEEAANAKNNAVEEQAEANKAQANANQAKVEAEAKEAEANAAMNAEQEKAEADAEANAATEEQAK